MNKAAKVVALLFGMLGCLLFVVLLTARADTFYVSNPSNSTILVFNSSGQITTGFVSGLSTPSGLAFYGTNLYVANFGNNTIEVFNTNGQGRVFASSGLVNPSGLAIDKSGNLYVANYGTNTITRFNLSGQGTLFANAGVSSPLGLACDNNGNVYVANAGNGTVEKFNSSGVGGPLIFGLYNPVGVAVDSNGNVFVSNLCTNDPDGCGPWIEKISTNGTPSVFADGVNSPAGMAFDSASNLCVVLSYADAIEKFNPGGTGTIFASNLNLFGSAGIAVQYSPPLSTLILGCPTNSPGTNILGQCYLSTNTNTVYGGNGAGVIPFGVPTNISANAMYTPYAITRQDYIGSNLGELDFGGDWLANMVSGCGCSVYVGEQVPLIAGNQNIRNAFAERFLTNPYVVMPVIPSGQGNVGTISGFVWAEILSVSGNSGNPVITLENVPSCGNQVPPADDSSVPVYNACAGGYTVTNSPDVISNQTCPSKYTITRTYIATDTCGDTGSITQIIQVNDTTPPFIDCPSSINASTDPGKCTAENVNLGTPTAGASCFGSVTLTNNAPTVFQKGTTSVIWTATDPCGNTATCTQTVTVMDSQPPTISCPVPVNVSCASAVPSPNTGSVTATDNCGSVTVTFVGDVITNQTCANRYAVLRTYRATDASGNSATCTQMITVNATNPPAITAPGDVTAYTDPGLCSASNVALGSPTASSFCGDAVIVTSNAPAVFPKGTTQVIWSATDTCGNSAAATQNVLVVDNQPPAISCPANILANAVDSNGATVTFTVAATDNCDSNLTVNCSPVSGSEFAVGTTPVNCVVVDSSGNSNTCSFSVTVVNSTVFNILSIAPQGSDILLSWIMPLGFTGVVQGTAGAGDGSGSYSNNFTDVSSPFYAPGNGVMTNTFVDPGALTNSPWWYYRVRLVP